MEEGYRVSTSKPNGDAESDRVHNNPLTEVGNILDFRKRHSRRKEGPHQALYLVDSVAFQIQDDPTTVPVLCKLVEKVHSKTYTVPTPMRNVLVTTS